MTSVLIMIVLIGVVGAAYVAGGHLLSKRAAKQPIVPPPPEKEHGETCHRLSELVSTSEHMDLTPDAVALPPTDEPAAVAGGEARPEPGPASPVEGAAQKCEEMVATATEPGEQCTVAKDRREPELQSAEEAYPDTPTVEVQTPDDAVKPVGTVATDVGVCPESLPPAQVEAVPPAIDVPIPELTEAEIDSLWAVTVEPQEPESIEKPAESLRVEPEPPEVVEETPGEKPDAQDEGATANGNGVDVEPAEPGKTDATATVPERRPRRPRTYRPTAHTPPRSPEGSGVRPEPTEADERNRALSIEVRVVIERGGYCRVSLLPRRTDRLPETLAVSGSGDPRELAALQEEWYQDISPPDLGLLLQRGVEWEAELGKVDRICWSLAGRKLFVLAGADTLSGYISVTRLLLGEEHVVLCTSDILPRVQEAIRLSESPAPTILGAADGIPDGWVGLKGVKPQISVARSAEGEILDVLRPLADVEIVVTGGIKIGRSTWLAGFPPRICLRGDTAAAGGVLIDGQPVSLASNGGYTVPGWDNIGEHLVWCNAGSKTYRIEEGAEEWPEWDAYTWPVSATDRPAQNTRSAICGALVRPPDTPRGPGQTVLVPTSNGLLIGSAPGEVYTCAARHDLAAPYRMGNPPFRPVWALPVDALGCDRRSARILRIGGPRHVQLGRRRLGKRQKCEIRTWALAILNACRKGLRTDPGDPEAAPLWREYRQRAQAIRRSLR